MTLARFRLQELIDKRMTSQSALARDSGVSFATVSRMCRNVTGQVSLDTLAKLAQALGDDLTPGDLIEFSRDKAKRRR
jgi:DNA-binding Xre family transcriptional regulator